MNHSGGKGQLQQYWRCREATKKSSHSLHTNYCIEGFVHMLLWGFYVHPLLFCDVTADFQGKITSSSSPKKFLSRESYREIFQELIKQCFLNSHFCCWQSKIAKWQKPRLVCQNHCLLPCSTGSIDFCSFSCLLGFAKKKILSCCRRSSIIGRLQEDFSPHRQSYGLLSLLPEKEKSVAELHF